MYLAWFPVRSTNKQYHICLQCRPMFLAPNETIIIAEEKSLWDNHPHLELCYRCSHRRRTPDIYGPCTPTNGYDLMEEAIRAKFPNTPLQILRIQAKSADATNED